MYKTVLSADILEKRLERPDWVIFDCRFALDDPEWGRQEYRRSHIPGARYAHLDEDLAGPKRPDTGRHPLPDPGSFSRWLGDQGVDAGKQVVAYDQDGGAFAARLWWMLRWLGHQAVAVLDGGWAAWSESGYALSDEAPNPTRTRFEARVNDRLWLTSEQLEAALGENRVRLIDARGAARFRGDSEPIDPVAGHVPGAVNLPFTENLDERGRFTEARKLRERFQAVLDDVSSRDAVHMCGSGVTACHNLLAMEVAGLADSKLYAGSWSEWIADPERSVAKGD